MENGNSKDKKKGMFHSASSAHRSRHKHMKGVVIHKGWLRRKPRISGYWRNRYFVLTEYEKGMFLFSFLLLFEPYKFNLH